jgi:signal transduction histidine kinase
MKSIRNYLTVVLLLGLGVLCGVAGLVASHLVRKVILREFDYSLRTKAHNLFTLTEREDNGYEFEFSNNPMPEFERAEHPEYYQIRLKDGDSLARSPSLSGRSLPLPGEPLSELPRIYNLTLPNGLPGRAAAIEVVPRWGEDSDEGDEHEEDEHEELDEQSNRVAEAVTIVLARDTVRLKRVFTGVAAGFSIGTLLILLVIALAIKWVVTAGLRPLDALAQQAVAIQPENLTARFTISSMPIELRPIADQLNRLLERIDLAFQRERYLTAGMAHELFTPIAELRLVTELALKWPEDQEATSAVADNAHAIALQMQHLVEALLSLSRCESGVQEVACESVDVIKLLENTRCSVEEQLETKKIKLTWEMVAPGICVETDRTMLSVVLSNLVKNAAEYTPEGGLLSCRIISSVEGHEVVVTNTNQDLVAEDLEHLFEPMWRKDKSRTGSSHGGLGLAVAERFCNVLGIQLIATLPEPDQFQITLFIPEAIAR